MIRILIADDHLVVREGLQLILGMEDDLEVVGEVPDGETAVRLAAELQPDVILMDIGLPGMSGFVSEVLVLIGAWQVYPLMASAAVIGIVVTAAFLLWTLQRVFLGPLNPKYADFKDVTGREIFTMAPLAILGR